jgi:hypothetical protein
MEIRKFGVSALEENISYPIDVFICCGSYEDRCRTIADAIKPEEVTHAIVVENKNLSAYVGKNAKYLREKFEGKAIDVATHSGKPVMTADNLVESIKKVTAEKPNRLLIDITTFRHESLLILLYLLRMLTKPADQIMLVYTTASDYSIGEQIDEKWLSKGVGEVRTVLGYSGDISPSKKMHLIVLVGFEYQRASRLIEVLEPNTISLGNGAPESSTEPKHIASQKFFYDLTKKIVNTHGIVEGFEFACNNPIDTKNAIISQMAKHPDNNTVVAPMNTKLSTIGAGLSAFEHSEIQICYAEALHYNYHGYSSPGSNCYLFQLKLK